MSIEINVTDKRAVVGGTPIIVCGNSDYKIEFVFDAEWDDYDSKTARFAYLRGGAWHYEDVVFVGTVVAVPILEDIREVCVGVYAGNLCTSTPARIMCKPSIRCTGGAPVAPAPSQYDQIMELLSSGALEGPAGADGVSCTHQWEGTVLKVTSASGTSSADLKGEPGKTGSQGEKGDPGLVYEDIWDENAVYVDGEVVTHNGSAWVCVGGEVAEGVEPGTDDASWALLASKGDTGPQGPQGEKGDTGATGPQGPQGEKGEKGDTGATGPQGPQGEKGETGAAGSAGADGYTPVKGTDYWTEEDKAEIVREISPYTFKGKKVMFFGDSITYGADQYVPKLIEYTGMVNVGNHAQNGANLYHSASEMTTESATKDTVPGQVQLLLDNLASYDVPDIIIVSAGTNGSTPSPNYDESQYTNDAGEYINFDYVDLHTYSGAMRWVYEKLNACYPLAKIFFATPLQVYGGSARTYGDLKDRAECIRQNCQRLATPCIDAFIKSGIYGRYERSSAQGRYLKDGLHLNANGAILLANCYKKEIANVMIDCADVPSIQPENDPELVRPAPTYTNQVPISIDTDGSVFNGVGYQNGYRISTSSGSASAESNSTISGYIPATNGDVIRVYGVDWYNASGSKNVIAGYDSSFAYIGALYGAFKGTSNYLCENPVVLNDYDAQATIRSAADLGKTVAYIRVSSLGLGVATDGANMIVTVNEEIV